MNLTNIRHIDPPAADFHVATSTTPHLRAPRYAEYAKANQRWWIELRFNSEADLAAFEKALNNSPLRLAELNKRYFLEDPRIPDTADMHAAFAHAEEHLPRLHAAIKLLCPQYIPAQCHALAELSENGTGRSIVQTQAQVHSLQNLNGIAAFLARPHADLASLLTLAANDKDVSEALYFFSAGGNPWSNLYKVIEIIDETVGIEFVVASGWCSEAAWRRFKQTANHQEAIGRFSRHARMNRAPPADPMTLNDARQLTITLLRAWTNNRRTPHQQQQK